MDMIVAAGGGERDAAVDAMILSGLRKAERPAAFLNERLMNDLRPTLFLAQLSNLLAGNISIVHGVTGSSRTFMGEESAGVDAVRIARARIAAGQSEIALVGGCANADQISTMLLFVMGHRLWRGELKPLWERAAAGGGLASGSLGAFLVLEEKAHAQARGATPFARLSAVLSGHARRTPGAITAMLDELWERHRAAPADARARDHLGRHRRRARDRRGARLPGGARRHCDPRHRLPSRPWGGGAISHECRARRHRAPARPPVPHLRPDRLRACYGCAAAAGRGHQRRALARRRTGAARGGPMRRS